MAAKKAQIIIRNEKGTHAQGGPENADLVLKAGEKGTGQDIKVVHYWPWSPKSVEKAYDVLYEVAKREGYEIIPAAEE
jgi:hypothetical protein